mmetsp:Transcript_13848/g.20906  ORF Transcript_13848/g.20906 Transcript_13848/m.20906 type:complete len:455 (+) Transcript_13848:2-1366(+)
MNDSETVALIGGGHAFGKTHGACPKGAGPSPREDPENPWPGLCGTGKGADAFTSGFEGPWTADPTTFDNKYFKYLVDFEWEYHKGPGGHYQWRVKNATSPVAPGPQGGHQNIMMLTSDISLKFDPKGSYQEIIKKFAEDQDAFANAFAHAWYKLTTRDMGPVTRCMGKDVPPPQPFQYPLPDASKDMANFTSVAKDVRSIVQDGDAKALLIRLAWQCASTFRQTDYLGGCNGARIRFAPQTEWPTNKGLDKALEMLDIVKEKYGESLSWADLIVLAGGVSLEESGASTIPFCGGRTDAKNGEASAYLYPKVIGDISETIATFRQSIRLSGLTNREFVALMGGHSVGHMHSQISGYTGQWTETPGVLSNDYFKLLLNETWKKVTNPDSGKVQYKASGKDIYMLRTDLLIRFDDELQVFAQEFASDNKVFLEAFKNAWVKIMNIDRFKGSAGNVCI